MVICLKMEKSTKLFYASISQLIHLRPFLGASFGMEGVQFACMLCWCLPQLNSFTKSTDVAEQPHWCDNLPPCKSELFLNSCPQRKHGEEFFTPNLCISYIPTHQLRTLPHILPQIHTLSKINTFLPPLTFPYCPGWSLDAQKSCSTTSWLQCIAMGDLGIFWGLFNHPNIVTRPNIWKLRGL